MQTNPCSLLSIFFLLLKKKKNARYPLISSRWSPSKRVALAIAIRSNDSHVCYADTRGDVWVVELDGIDECKVSPSNKTARLLFRSSSIVTKLVSFL